MARERGATAVYAACTHGVFAGLALERLALSDQGSWRAEFRGDVFIAEPTGHLLKRIKLSPNRGAIVGAQSSQEGTVVPSGNMIGAARLLSTLRLPPTPPSMIKGPRI